MKILLLVGGGLGDIFLHFYSNAVFQILAEVSIKNHVDALCMCSNPASKSVLGSMMNGNGNPLFENITYKNFWWDKSYPDEYNVFIKSYTDLGYHVLKGYDDTPTMIDVLNTFYPHFTELGFYSKRIHWFDYKLTYQEQEFFNSVSDLDYIIVHPSGGLQAVDGITRDEYGELIKKLLVEFPEKHIIAIGSNHTRLWIDKITLLPNDMKVSFTESEFNMQYNRFIDLTNKTSGALCAKIVEKASCFVGTHSCWIALFSFFKKPTVCILSNDTDWGTAENYIKTNAFNWMFSKPYVYTAIVNKPLDELYNEVIDNLKGLINGS